MTRSKLPPTVKLRGRTQAPDWSRGCTLFPRTHGDTRAPHGPPQRLSAVVGAGSAFWQPMLGDLALEGCAWSTEARKNNAF
jgi:hypothetical protein